MTGPADRQTTSGSLLGGRVRYAQPRDGFRSGIEPVLLAACIPARSGQRVIEAGTGAGAALLCLAARVPGLSGVGVERDSAMAALARDNLAANGFDGLDIVAADIEHARDRGLAAGSFDHAFANPPYHAAGGTPSGMAAREAAKRAHAGLFGTWAASRAVTLLPLWPKAEREAKLVLLRGIRHGRGPLRLLPGLVLHAPEGGFMPEADAILRDGAGLTI